ncbi:MAG: hypothetical protein ABMB14_36400, partial [Myxococcota bacterium]
AQGRRGIELDVRWSPPWTPMLALLWFAVLGIARGEGLLTVSIAVGMALAVWWLYAERAQRAAAELRWAFVRGSEAEPPDAEV